MFDYEKLVYDATINYKRVWIKKATGLGITEFFIYFMLWLALCRPRRLQTWLTGSHMVIVTGPREETAVKIIGRAKAKLEAARVQNPSEAKETVIKVGDITIQAFPSFNASWRGLDKISFILIDEADFFREGEQEEVRAVAERYIGKSQAWIALVSTPHKPGGLFNRIEQEDPCLYYKLPLDYHYGEGKIYTPEDIAEAKKSPQFGREYEGQYLGLVGTCFSEQRITECLNNGGYDPEALNPYALRAIGIDPGWGSSAFGITVTEYSDGQIKVLDAREFTRPDYETMLTEIYHLYRQTGASKILIDGSAADLVQSVKAKIGERTDYLQQKHEYTSQGRNWDIAPEIKVLPIYFGRQNKQLLTHTKNLIDNGLVAINHRFDKLLIALRTASEEQGVIDKEKSSYHDILDSFMLSLWYFQIQ
jgi:hypothetical protein